MALDPSISLDVRPPQFNIQVPNPLEQFGQVLSLGNLMQQRQLFPLELEAKQLGLQQQRLAYQQDLNLMNAITHPELTTTSVAPATPGGLMVGQGQGGAAIHSPDSGVSWVNSTTGTPYTGPRYGETPIGAGPAGVPYDASAATVQPVLPPVSTPAALSVAAPAPAAPPVTTPPAAGPAAAAPAPPVPSGGIPGMPSWERMIQVGGARAFPWIKNINEAQKSQLDIEKSQLEVAKGKSEDMVRLANGMTTNDFKNHLLTEAGNKGYIPWDDVRKYSDMDVSDPRFQAQKDSWGQQALTYDKSVELANARNEEARKQNKEVRDYTDYWDKQHIEQERQLREKVNAMSDPTQFGAMLNTDHLRNLYGSLIGKSLNEIKIGTGAGKPGETVPYPASVVAGKGAIAGAEASGRQQAELTRLAPTIESVLAGKTRLQDVDPADQKTMMPALIERGYGQQGTPTETTGGQFGKLISDAERERLGDYDRAKTVLQNSLSLIHGYVPDKEGKDTNQKTVDYMGPVEGLKAYSPWATLHQNVQSALVTQQQQLKKFITNGSLRGLNEKTLDEMFPAITNTPEHATSVIYQLMKTVEDEKQAYLRDLSDKVIPAGLKSTAATPPQTPAAGKPAPTLGPAPGPRLLSAPADVQAYLKNKPWGQYDLEDPSGRRVVYFKNKDGSIQPVGR